MGEGVGVSAAGEPKTSVSSTFSRTRLREGGVIWGTEADERNGGMGRRRGVSTRASSASSASLARLRFTEPIPGPSPAFWDEIGVFPGERRVRVKGIGFGRTGDCPDPLLTTFWIGFLMLIRTGGPMELGAFAGVRRMGVEGRNGLKRKRGSSGGAAGLPTLPGAEDFFGDTEASRGFFLGEKTGLEGEILPRDGVIGCRTRPESIPRTSDADVEDETVLAVDVSDALRGSAPTFDRIGDEDVTTHGDVSSGIDGDTSEETEAESSAQPASVVAASAACVAARGSFIVETESVSSSCGGLVGDEGTTDATVSSFPLTESLTCRRLAAGNLSRLSSAFGPSSTMSIPELLRISP